MTESKNGIPLQITTIQKSLYDIDGPILDAQITVHHLINIIMNSITPQLCQAGTHYQALHSNLSI